MRILTTGGTGFLGSTLASRARLDGHEALTLNVSETADIRCEMSDSNAVHAAVTHAKSEVIVHLAALFSAAGACSTASVIYASSVAAVGPRPANSGDDVTLRPVTAYGVTKAFGEHLARDLASQLKHLSLWPCASAGSMVPAVCAVGVRLRRWSSKSRVAIGTSTTRIFPKPQAFNAAAQCLGIGQ